MDDVFQSILAASGRASSSPSDAAPGGAGAGAVPAPPPSGSARRGSRLARLAASESLRPPDPPAASPRRKGRGGGPGSASRGSGGAAVDPANDPPATPEGDGEPDVRVYRLDDSGRARLLPRQDYDVLYPDDDGEEDRSRESGGDGTDEMDIVDDRGENDDGDTTLYIVRDVPKSHGRDEQEGGDTDPPSDSDDCPCYPSDLPPARHRDAGGPAESAARSASETASAVARALAARTAGHGSARPSYGLDDRPTRDERRRQREEERGASSRNRAQPSPGKRRGDAKSAVAGGRKDGRDGSSVRSDVRFAPGTAGEERDASPARAPPSRAELRSRRILSGLPPSSDVVDGETASALDRMTAMRIRNESEFDPRTAGVEMDSWEDGIDWEGGGCTDEDEEDVSEHEEKSVKKEARSNEDVPKSGLVKIESGTEHSVKLESGTEGTPTKDPGAVRPEPAPSSAAKDADDEDEEECTPDYNCDDLSFRPPSFRNKRPRRGGPLRSGGEDGPDDDPMRLLAESFNPRLEALDLASVVDWEGGASDDDDGGGVGGMAGGGRGGGAKHVPLILQSSLAGASVSSLLAPCPARPRPFESHPSCQRRLDRESAALVTSTAELSLSRPGMMGNEERERLIEMRQRKREAMAREKQSRVGEVMANISQKGTGRRITSSLMGPGGAERTGRPSRHAMGTTAHDAEYVEQLEIGEFPLV